MPSLIFCRNKLNQTSRACNQKMARDFLPLNLSKIRMPTEVELILEKINDVLTRDLTFKTSWGKADVMLSRGDDLAN